MDELRVDPERKTREGQPPPPVRTPTRRPYFWVGIVLVVLAALAWWVHTRPAPQAPAGRFGANGVPMPVVTQAVTKGDIPVTYDALGTVTPLATVSVVTQIAGQIVDVAFTEGQEVKKGDVLVQIDPRPYQAALDQAAGQLARDQASLAEARVDLVRYQKLAEQNSIARQQAEDQVFVVQQDEGTVKLDQALVDNARLNLSYCRIVAPVGGRIGLRQVDPGNYLQVGSATPIAVITQMQPITVVFTLPEDELPQVMKRLAAGAKLPVTAFDRSNTQKLADGTLSAVDSAIDVTTGTVKLRAEFAEHGRGALSQPVRQRAPPHRHGAGYGGDPDRGGAARPARHLRLSRQAGRHGERAEGDARAAVGRQCRRQPRALARRQDRGGRRRQVARGRQDRAAHRAGHRPRKGPRRARRERAPPRKAPRRAPRNRPRRAPRNRPRRAPRNRPRRAPHNRRKGRAGAASKIPANEPRFRHERLSIRA